MKRNINKNAAIALLMLVLLLTISVLPRRLTNLPKSVPFCVRASASVAEMECCGESGCDCGKDEIKATFDEWDLGEYEQTSGGVMGVESKTVPLNVPAETVAVTANITNSVMPAEVVASAANVTTVSMSTAELEKASEMTASVTTERAVRAPDGMVASAEKYNAKSALLMDASTGQILQSQNADEKRPIASMVKIMTLLQIFGEIESGNMTLDQSIEVSENASSMGGSQAFLDAHASYKVDELIKSIVVASANDSCVAMAEHIAGSVEDFVVRMNEKAAALGLSNTNFVNCTGLPAPNQYSTAGDVAVMFRELIKHEQFFEYAKIWMYDFAHPDGRVTGLTNTNKLVRFYNGCDGGKTGFTSEALSCLAATAKRGDTRLISVVIAAPSSKERNAEVSKMFNYGFANYETRQIVFKGIEIDEKATVEKGKVNCVTIAPAVDYFHLIKKGEKPKIEITSEINKIKAPVSKGDVAGKINVHVNGEQVGEVNLITMSDIGKASYLDFVDKLIESW